MKQPIQSDGEAMSGVQENDAARDSSLLILDAQDIVAQARDLTRAVFMAAHGLGDRLHMSAITTITDIIDDKLREVRDILDAVREASL